MGKLLITLGLFVASVSFAETYKLENSKIRFEIDDKGSVVSLKNFETNKEYAGGGGLWRIIYQDGLSLEEKLESEDVPVEIKKEGEKLILNYGGEFPVNVECTLDGDDVRFVPTLKNFVHVGH